MRVLMSAHNVAPNYEIKTKKQIQEFMKRTFTLLLLAAFAGVAALAQTFRITGTVKNAQTGDPVEMATVQLMQGDSTLVTGANTAVDGRFELKTKHAGRLRVKVSFVSFKPITRQVELSEKNDSVALGDILLESSGFSLGSALVTGTAARVEQKEDTTVFNASAYRVPEGSTLEALVKQLPGVEVGDDGSIKWNGKQVKEFLVNGKDFFKGDTKVAMQNLPTEWVNRIKAYDKASEYTEQTGIDDGEETTVLDIATKRALNESWITNLDLSYGTKDRYAENVFLSRFTDNSRISAYGRINNVNNRGFGGPGWGGGGGLTTTKEAGADFTWENGKKKREPGRLELGGSVKYRSTDTDAVSTSNSETFLTAGSSRSFNNRHSQSLSSSTSFETNLKLQWSPDSMTTITFRPSFSHSNGDNSSESRTGTFNDDPYAIENMANPLDSIMLANVAAINPELAAIAVNRNRRQSLGSNQSNSVNGSLMVVRRFGNKGRNITLRANAGHSKGKNNSYSISDIYYFDTNRPSSFLNQYSTTPSMNWNYGVRLSYTEPLSKYWFAEARYDYGFRYNESNRSLYNLDLIDADTWGSVTNHPLIGTLPTPAELAAEGIRDDANSQYATYKTYDHRANVGVRYKDDKIRFNAGVDFNPQLTKMEYNRPAQLDTVITRQVFNVSPQVRFRYKFSKTNRLDINYRGSASQPSMTDLLDVVNDSDPLSISMGNPGLKPSWSNSFRAMYHGYNTDRQQGIMGGIDGAMTSNSISTRIVYDENTGVRYTRPENISGNWNANGRFMFNTALGAAKLFNISTFTSVRYSNSVGYVSRYESTPGGRALLAAAPTVRSASSSFYNEIFSKNPASKNVTRDLRVDENLNISYRTSWFDVGLLGSLNYQHARSKLQERSNLDTWSFAYGANANFNFDFGLSLSTDIRMNSRRGYSDKSMNTNELLWNAQIAQSFNLFKHRATVSLQFYDILQQQSNVSRTINAMSRTDSWNNAINSYCMLHFIYRLNIFGGTKKDGKKKNDQPKMGPGGPGRFGGGGMPPMPMGGRPF